ncbi:MAG: hypothetical protein K1X90_14195 [Candidatus Kapabacteria bacterium]|nr:hypothetical protein [Candidatus Kapabacteria bacterium]
MSKYRLKGPTLRPLRLPFLLVGLLWLVGSSLLRSQQLEMEKEEENPMKRMEFYFNLRAYPFGTIPKGARQDAIIQMTEKMRQHRAPFQALKQWRQLGPYDLGGRIHTVAVHPTDGKTLWAGAANGGVWKSTNRGDTWRPVMDSENSLSMGAIAVDPKNPDILYAGTGEPVSANGDTYNGAGILKSTDGGETWKPLGLTNVGSITDIVINPNNTNNIIASGVRNNAGLYWTEDGGITWTRSSNIAIADLSMHPTNPNTLLIGTFSNGLYRTTDGGKSIGTKVPGIGTSSVTVSRISVEFAHSDGNIAYALAYEYPGTTIHYSRIYKSTNGGQSWTNSFDSDRNGIDFLANVAQSQGYYNNVISVHPTNPNIVLAGGVYMVRTGNGGNTWNQTGNEVHVDHHAMAFDPSNPNVFYSGNDGGMFRSEDAGVSFDKKTRGLAITQFYAMAIDQKKDSLNYGGTQDNGTVTSSSAVYGNIMGGDGFFVVVDHNNSNIYYAENPEGENISAFINGRRYTVMSGIDTDEDAGWAAPLVMDPSRSEVMYTGRQSVYRSITAGTPSMTWERVSPYFAGNVSAIAVSPASSDVVYAGSTQGTVMVSTDGGEQWSDVSNGHGLPNRAVTDFAPALKQAGTAYISFSGFYSSHVYRTTDFGQTWSDASNGLPDIPINALAVHSDDDNIIYAGSDIGMFISTDGGSSWANYNNGFPRTEIRDIEIHKTKRTVRAATHGRSMWEVDLEVPTIPPSINSPVGGEVWRASTSQLISWRGFTGPVHLDYSLDDGRTWKRLKNNLAGEVMRWVVFDTATIEARIRVTSIQEPSQSVVSNSFTIERYSVGTVLNATGAPGVPYGICYDGEFLWATNFSSNKLLKIDPKTLISVAEVTIQIPGADSLFTDITYIPERGTFFLHRLRSTGAEDPGGFLYEITKEGERVNQWTSPFKYPIGLAWLGARNPDQPYLYMSDRNGAQEVRIVSPDAPLVPLLKYNRTNQVRYGPRGACAGADGLSVWQVITDFTGDVLNRASATRFNFDDDTQAFCPIDLTAGAASGYINARGIELDPADSNIWVSDYQGSIYKLTTCDYKPSIPSPDVPTAAPIEAAVTGLRLSENHPNPFTSATDVRFTIEAPTSVRLGLVDGQGRRVMETAAVEYEQGEHLVRLQPVGIAAGTYRLVLYANGKPAESRTVVYLK